MRIECKIYMEVPFRGEKRLESELARESIEAVDEMEDFLNDLQFIAGFRGRNVVMEKIEEDRE